MISEVNVEDKIKSLPARERGLKQEIQFKQLSLAIVAPRAGAWIETIWNRDRYRQRKSLPARERGLKPGSGLLITPHTCRSPRGSVD